MPSPEGADVAACRSALGSGHVDALVLLSFGAPERPEEVMPFLENVTRGRGVPRERLEHVAEHYLQLGGVSPLNELNLEIIANLEKALAARGRSLPVLFGNRNWAPFLDDVVAQLARDGHRRVAVFATSAWGGYSGCAQYQEDIATAIAGAGPDAPEFVRLRQFFDTDKFVEIFADATTAQLDAARAAGEAPRLVFTAHSVPDAADDAAGPAGERNLYSRQVRAAAEAVAQRCGVSDYDVVWQSRSGPPSVPWLVPDVADHVRALAASGTRSVVVCPIGFISDHVEVVWDLDRELADECAELGMMMRRVATPGPEASFTEMILELLDEVESGVEPSRIGRVPSLGCTADGARCAPDCCLSVRRGQPSHAPGSSA